jgi:hypothetical protein
MNFRPVPSPDSVSAVSLWWKNSLCPPLPPRPSLFVADVSFGLLQCGGGGESAVGG